MGIGYGGLGSGQFNPFISTSRSTSGGIFGNGNLPDLSSSFTTFQKTLPPPTQIDLKSLPTFQVPKITVPRINAAVVSTPADLANRVNTIYAPRYADLARNQELSDKAQQAALANAGLADSGAGIASQRNMDEQFGREKAALEGQQASDQLNVEYNTLLQNAANQQAASLAQAQLDTAASTANAQMILAGRTAEADNYMKAIGINASIADSYRNGFLSFFSDQQKLALQKDSLAQSFNASLLDAMLKQAGLEMQASQQQQANKLEQEKIDAAKPQTYSLQPQFNGIAGELYQWDKPASTPSWYGSAGSTSPTLAMTQRLFGNGSFGGRY